MTTDHFAVLGVPRRFHLDRALLEGKFLALQKELHPDRFAKAPPKERLQSLQKTTELNDAYRVLKDDVKRAEYLLKLEGLDVADERPPMPGDPDRRIKAAPQLLVSIMELREELSEAKGENDVGRVEKLTQQVEKLRREALSQIDNHFNEYERGEKGVLDKLAQELISLRYYGRFMEEVEGNER